MRVLKNKEMHFNYLNIKKLFGLYDYKIAFFDEEKLTILTGPNGYGKTTILTLLDSLSPESLYYFYQLKFEMIEIGLSDETRILVEQRFTEENDDRQGGGDIRQALVKEVRFSWLDKDEKELCYFLYNDKLIRKARREVSYRSRSWLFDLNESPKEETRKKSFNEVIAHNLGQDIFLMQLEALRTKFIHANRIYNEAKEENDSLPIQRIRKKLQKELYDAYQYYLQQSQRIDSQFINRVILKQKSEVSEKEYRYLASEVEKKRDLLFYFRLTDYIEIPTYDKDNSFILYNYVKGLGEKYDKYDGWTEKLTLFDKLLKAKKFARKNIIFSPQHGFQIYSSTGDIIDESLLSSGEQNEIILLFQLIFEVSDHSILLIDEPENSLHVVWQQTFLEDIMEIAKIKNLQVIVSTHSISIVSKGSDKAIDLYYLQQHQ